MGQQLGFYLNKTTKDLIKWMTENWDRGNKLAKMNLHTREMSGELWVA